MRQPVPWSSPQPAPVPSILISATQQLAFEGAHGDLTSEYPRLGASGFRVSRVLSAGGELFLTDDPGAILLFASRGGVVVRVGETEGHLGPGEAVFLHSYGRLTLTLRPEQDLFEGRLLMLPLAELHDLARLAGGPALPDAAMVPITGPSARRLADFVAFLLTNLEHRDQSQPSTRSIAGMAALVRDLLLDWLAQAQSRPKPVPRPAATVELGRVKRAEELLHARAEEAVSIAQIARALGLSLRSLQKSFQNIHGEGPRTRLTRIRLEKARERLLDAGPHEQVTSIALDCGFTHLSRFADAYHRFYGERPSETLANCRRHHPPGRGK